MANYSTNSVPEVYEKLGADGKGLKETEINERINTYGYNEIADKKQLNPLQVFLQQFADFLVIILIIAGTISLFLGEWESSLVILLVVLINAILGTVQHMKAENSLNSLKNLAAPTAKVLRQGEYIQIPSREVVPGDIILLEAGDFISADARLIEGHRFQVNESALTGESLAVEKDANIICSPDTALGDQLNMVFSGSFVANGRATAIVTATGMETEIGKIADLLGRAQDKKTPLQVSLDDFGKKLAFGIIIICIIIFALDIIRGRELVDSFMFVVSLAVAAIPEALSSIVTIVLAFGTQKMAKENAIIRKLHAVESLGSVSIICSDKTGTLTQNQMVVQRVFVNNEDLDVSELHPQEHLHRRFLESLLLCNDAVTQDTRIIGDPTEVALVNAGEIYEMDELQIRKQYPRLAENPFDSDRKCMSTLHDFPEGRYIIVKGAVDVLLPRMTSISTSDGNEKITDAHIEKILQLAHTYASQGLRVLAFAMKEHNENDLSLKDEYDLTFIGLTAMMDPPRNESKSAVEACLAAGIKPIMITGDHKQTAIAIAKQLGILTNAQEAIEGKEIEHLTDEKLIELVPDIAVYARVSPEHKIRIVKAWQARGHLVAMTGDGVNDGPALKQADIGVAMGITGTEVAKDASSMILTDDNFSTIVKAIANGRSIYTNIKLSIRFLLSGNMGAIFAVLYATLLALPAPFAPVHLLFINLLTDSLPAIGIGLEPHREGVMKSPPRKKTEALLNKTFATGIVLEGLLIAIVTIIAFEIGLDKGVTVGSTMAFATLCLARLFHSFNCRSEESLLKIGIFKNKQIIIAFLVGVLLLHAVLLIPGLSGVFEVANLTIQQLLIVYVLAFIPLLVIQSRRLIKQ